jgi:hypothetical protein
MKMQDPNQTQNHTTPRQGRVHHNYRAFLLLVLLVPAFLNSLMRPNKAYSASPETGPRTRSISLAGLAPAAGASVKAAAKPQSPYVAFIPLIVSGNSVASSPTISKRGLADTGTCAQDTKLGVTWRYNWDVNPGAAACPGVESVGMIWGDYAIGWNITASSNYLLGFNEPERSDQANLSPETAAEYWHDIETTYPTYKLVSPANLWGLGQNGIAETWLRAWRAAYVSKYGKAPRVDAVAFHWYGWQTSDATAALGTVTKIADEWNVRDLWLTEFAFMASGTTPCYGYTESQALSEAGQFLTNLDKSSRVVKYAWFATSLTPTQGFQPLQCNAPLFSQDGTMTTFGNLYKK